MPRRLTPEELRRRSLEADRVRLLLDTHFEGNQSLMAERLPASQSLISKVVRGEQMPGRKLMEKLARVPGVSADWVLYGRGQPLLPPMKGTLPVAVGVLPGSPDRYPHLLTGERHPVAESNEGASRYWLPVREHSPLVQVTAWGILPGDLLLMDSSSDCTARLDLVVGQLCGVRLDRQPGTTYEVGRVEREGTGIVLALAKVIGRLIEPPPPPPPPPPRPPEPRPTPSGEGRPKRRILDLDQERAMAEERRLRAEERRRQQQQREEAEWQQREQLRQERERGLGIFTVADIVAVCVYLVRPTPASASAVCTHEGDNG
jgi:hypothetical protein